MTLASGWYSSGTFWAGAGTTVAVAGIIIGAWVAFAVGFPRRRLWYGLRSAVQVPSHAEADSSSKFELLFRRDRSLADPYIATVELVARSRVDIPSDAYDSKMPFQLDLGAPVIDVLLPVISRPETAPTPKIVAEGSILQVGPSLIGKRQQVTVGLLTEGKPKLSLRQSPLANVRVRERTYEVNPLLPTRLALLVAALLVGASAALGAVLATHGTPEVFGTSTVHNGHLLPYVKPLPSKSAP